VVSMKRISDMGEGISSLPSEFFSNVF